MSPAYLPSSPSTPISPPLNLLKRRLADTLGDIEVDDRPSKHRKSDSPSAIGTGATAGGRGTVGLASSGRNGDTPELARHSARVLYADAEHIVLLILNTRLPITIRTTLLPIKVRFHHHDLSPNCLTERSYRADRPASQL